MFIWDLVTGPPTQLKVWRGVGLTEKFQCIGSEGIVANQAILDDDVIEVVGAMYQYDASDHWKLFQTLGNTNIAKSGDTFKTKSNQKGIIHNYTQEQMNTITAPFMNALRAETQRFIETAGSVFIQNDAYPNDYSRYAVSKEGLLIPTRPVLVIRNRQIDDCGEVNADGNPLLKEGIFFPAASADQTESVDMDIATQSVFQKIFTANHDRIFETQRIDSWVPFYKGIHYPSDQ